MPRHLLAESTFRLDVLGTRRHPTERRGPSPCEPLVLLIEQLTDHLRLVGKG